MLFPERYDVIVVGGGHAGSEAAAAAARMGACTLLLTQSLETLGQMSCNPAIGGIGKGHLVKEIDALGGLMALGADHCGIHFRTLNASKGPAVRATRAQIDRSLYRNYIRAALERQENLTLFQQTVDDLVLTGDRIAGVVTQMGVSFLAPTVILTVGTFLDGRIHVGATHYQGGRAGDPPSRRLAEQLREREFRVGRLKTGTPPRIDGRTIDFAQLERQLGDEPVPVFSFLGEARMHPSQTACFITATNPETHDIIRAGLGESPLYSGRIEGVGPRYCPSIEDKVVRFADKSSHQIFVEPEGLNTPEFYPNGISTSLGFEVQLALVRSIKGFAAAHITRPGYAIEYDYYDPRDLHAWLETRAISGLFFAGQINGTTGYEEAAAQGLLAGINAGLRVQDDPPWYPRRDQAYLGVLVDDLVTRGTREPYRMFTSRAEYRLLLREDNADFRLSDKARELGLIGDQRWHSFTAKREALVREQARLDTTWLSPQCLDAEIATEVLGQTLSKDVSASDLLKRPEIDYRALMRLPGLGPGVERLDVIAQLEANARYAGYLSRQRDEIERLQAHEATPLPHDLDYASVRGLSREAIAKLNDFKPDTLGQAARISGITPAALTVLLVHLKKRDGRRLAS